LTDLEACGLLIRFSTILEADVFFFSAMGASPPGGALINDKRLYQTGSPSRNRAASEAADRKRHVIL
jgi:hypothetical protein